MDRDALVYVDLDGTAHLVGRLWARLRKGKEGASFEYDRQWLEHPARFSLEPVLQLGPGPFHPPADTPMLQNLFRLLRDIQQHTHARQRNEK